MVGQFWNNAAMEPKRAHRFLVEFNLPGPAGGTTTQIYARKVTKPAYDIGQSEHKFLGQTYYYPGAITWNDVGITLINSATPDFDLLLQVLLENAGYVNPDGVSNAPSGVTDASTVNKFDATNAIGRVLIKELNGDGGTIGEYELNNAWVKGIAYGDLDYGSEELLTVDVTLRYDWATYNNQPGRASG
jgi:hypothetical protein